MCSDVSRCCSDDIWRVIWSRCSVDMMCRSIARRRSAQKTSILDVLIQSGQNLRGPHEARQHQLSIDICCRPAPDLSSKPAGAVATVDRWDRQTDGQTDKRTDTRPFYESYGVLCGARNNAHLTRVRSVHQSLAICCVFTSQQVVRVICGFASNYSDHLLRSKHATNRHRLVHRPDTGQVCVITRSAESV